MLVKLSRFVCVSVQIHTYQLIFGVLETAQELLHFTKNGEVVQMTKLGWKF